MDVSRLYAVLKIIKDDFENNKIIEELTHLKTAFQQSISQPTPETGNAFKERFQIVEEQLKICKSNEMTPSYLYIVIELNAKNKIGNGFLEKINEILSQNSLTSANALEELNKYFSEVTQFYESIKAIVVYFENLGLKADELSANESEIGITIPRKIIQSNLEGFKKELHELNTVFKNFSEVSGEKVTSLNIKTVSSSEIQIFLLAGSIIAIGVATAIDKIVTLIKKIMEIRVLHNAN